MSKTQPPSTKIIKNYYIWDRDRFWNNASKATYWEGGKTRLALVEMFHKESTTLKYLQSLVGLLNFSCSVVVPGRAFLRRLLDLTCGLSEPNSKIQLPFESKADINAWLSFIKSFNGKSFFLPPKWLSSDHVTLHTDALGCHGFAATLGSSWFASSWDDDLVKYQIAV